MTYTGSGSSIIRMSGVGIKKPDPYDIFKANVCSGGQIDTTIKEICDKYGLIVNRNNKQAGNLSCLTLARDIFRREDGEYFEWCWNYCIRQSGMNFLSHIVIGLLILCMKSENLPGKKMSMYSGD